MAQKIHYLGKFPRVLVKLFIKDAQLEKVHLAPSLKGFECQSEEKIPDDLLHWLCTYCERKNPHPLPLTLHLPPFTQEVLESVQTIPFGELMTYGEIAKKIHHPRAFRAVGNACGRNPFPLFIPCHRVIASSGIGGFSLDLSVKNALIQFETHANKLFYLLDK